MKKFTKKQLLADKIVVEAINEIFRKAFVSNDDTETARACLSAIEKMTGSEFGWIGELNAGRHMDTIAVSSPGWDACNMPPEERTHLLKNMPLRSYWGQVFVEKKSIIVSDPNTHPLTIGLPPGHPPIACFLGVPIFHKEKCIGMIGLANKRNGYSQQDQQMVEAASIAVSEAIMKVRADTALKQALKEISQYNDQLKKRNAELDEFTYIVSHDLQSPLRKIISFSKLLHKDLVENIPDKMETDIHYIIDSANKMGALIADLLTLSRSGRSTMEWEQVSLSSCADRAIDALSVIIEEKTAEIEKDSLPEVEGDRTLLTLLFQNLIGNALKFTGKQPPKIRLTMECNENNVIFGVKDNGIGIAPEYLQLIFMPFMRPHRQDEYEGSGIGLSICRKIIERHNGRIWVESEEGKGSHFKFTLGKENGGVAAESLNYGKETISTGCH